MADLEKALRGLHCFCDTGYASDEDRLCDSCSCGLDVMNDARALLEKQVPRSVVIDDKPKNESWFGIWFGRCPNCKEMLTKKYHRHFCGSCGQAVKWCD